MWQAPKKAWWRTGSWAISASSIADLQAVRRTSLGNR
jgi:hypothetical protein